VALYVPEARQQGVVRDPRDGYLYTVEYWYRLLIKNLGVALPEKPLRIKTGHRSDYFICFEQGDSAGSPPGAWSASFVPIRDKQQHHRLAYDQLQLVDCDLHVVGLDESVRTPFDRLSSAQPDLIREEFPLRCRGGSSILTFS
jgi:hypothetical protein